MDEYLLVDIVNFPDIGSEIPNGYKLVIAIVVKLHLVHNISSC